MTPIVVKPGRSDRPSRRPTPEARSFDALQANVQAYHGAHASRAVAAELAPPVIPFHCETLAQFSRLYVGHVRAGSLSLPKGIVAERGRVLVRAILPNGDELEFPGEVLDEGDSAVVRFDRVPPEMHQRVAGIVSRG